MTILDLAVQLLTLGLSLLGAVAFYWQFNQRRSRRIRVLNRSVFRPWSKVEVKTRYRSYDDRLPAAMRFVTPAEAVRSDIDPTVNEEGLDIEDLPGFSDAERFLRSPRAVLFSKAERSLRTKGQKAMAEWDTLVYWRRKYEDARERRHAAFESMIAKDMAKVFPFLCPVPYYDYDMNTYIPANVLGKAEDESDWSLRPGKREVHVSSSRSSTETPGMFVTEITDSYSLLRADEKLVPNPKPFVDLLASWVGAKPIRNAATDMDRSLQQANAAAERFRDAMRDVSFTIDFEFPAQET